MEGIYFSVRSLSCSFSLPALISPELWSSRFFGLNPQGVRFHRGKAWIRRATMGLTLAALAALLVWQFKPDPFLEKSSLAKELTEEVKDVIRSSGLAQLVQANVSFTRADIEGQNSLLVVVYVQRTGHSSLSDSEVKHQLSRMIAAEIEKGQGNVTPLVDVTVFPERAEPGQTM